MVMKNTYVKPEMQVEEFLANTHIAECGDTNRVYRFECDIRSFSKLYEESNGQTGLQTSGGRGYSADKTVLSSSWGGYSGCNKTHEASTSDSYKDGYVTGGNYGSSGTPVKIWYDGTNANDIHVTTKVNMSEWEVVKS